MRSIYNAITNTKIIGNGGFGCVHKPPLDCLSNEKINNNYVSKTGSVKDTDDELKSYWIMETIDPSHIFHLQLRGFCNKIIKNKKNYNMLLKCNDNIINNIQHNPETYTIDGISSIEMDYGGINLLKFTEKYNFNQFLNRFNPILTHNKKLVSLFWKNSWTLIYGVCVLNKTNYVHYDLKRDNIVVDKNMNINMIDFGNLMEIDDWFRIGSSRHWYPYEMVYSNRTYTGKTNDYKIFFINIITFGVTDNEYKKYGFKTKSKIYEDIDVFHNKLNKLKTDVSIFWNNEYIKQSAKTVDSYGVGMSLLHVFLNTYKYFDDVDFIKEMYALLYSMVQPDPELRPANNGGLLEFYNKYVNVLKKINVNGKTNEITPPSLNPTIIQPNGTNVQHNEINIQMNETYAQIDETIFEMDEINDENLNKITDKINEMNEFKQQNPNIHNIEELNEYIKKLNLNKKIFERKITKQQLQTAGKQKTRKNKKKAKYTKHPMKSKKSKKSKKNKTRRR
jgi:hypothetical protein